jgi:F0F1-type ATP synthase assembly protein I
MSPDHARLAWLQGATTIIGAAIVYFAVSAPEAISVAYGCGVALAGTLFLAWRLREGKAGDASAEYQLRQAYRTAMERFVGMAFLLAAGFTLFKLTPLWLVAGFVIGQVAWLLIPIRMRLRTQDDKRSADLDRIH